MFRTKLTRLRLVHPLRASAAAAAIAAAIVSGVVAAPAALAQGAPDPSTDRPAAGTKGPAHADDRGAIPGEYIVQVEKTHDPKKLAEDEGAHPRFVWRDALNGFSAKLTDKQREKLERHPHVKTLEPNRRAELHATQYMNSSGEPWGLDRIDQRYLALSRTYSYSATGAGVHAYVIDTGIATGHPDFGGRANNVRDFVGGNGQDCHGHGTHVAGTIGGAFTGVAKRAWLHGVRIYNCEGKSSDEAIVNAINWVARYHVKPAVANMSFGTLYGPSAAFVTATNNLANAGVFVAAAAGNEGKDACQVSPANAAGALTVAASDRADARAVAWNWSSNHGPCVDVYAPGLNVLSAGHTGGYVYKGGTSMAAPHVAGLVALGKSWWGDGYTSAVWRDWVKNNATTNVIRNNPYGTVNRLIFKANNY